MTDYLARDLRTNREWMLAGVSVGDNAVVGAVVTKDLPANAVALGSSARVVRWI